MAARRSVYLCLTRDGMHLRGAAKRLNLHHATVQRHARFLLAAGVIEADGAPPAARAVSFYRRGPKAAEFEAGAPGAGGPGVAPPRGLLNEPHRGTVRIDAAKCPKDPRQLPGLWRTASPNGAPSFWYRVTAEAGVWSLQLNPRKDGSAALQVTPPAVQTRLGPDAAVETDESWRARAQKFAIAWGQGYGLELAREREAPRIVQPREWAMPMAPLKVAPAGVPGVSRAWADGSHPDSIETQDPDVVRFVADGPDLRKAWESVARQVRELLAAGLTSVEVVRQLATAQDAQSRAFATFLSSQLGQPAAAASPPASSPSPSPTDGYA